MFRPQATGHMLPNVASRAVGARLRSRAVTAKEASVGVVMDSDRDGLVEFAGAQSAIFATGKADGAVSIGSLEKRAFLYAIGPAKARDGEITVFESQPYISRARGQSYVVERSWNEEAIFLAWSSQSTWQDVSVPDTVRGYLDLQEFVKSAAYSAGLDVDKPFPFLLAGAPSEIRWHINVDRTEGRPIDRELFARSKATFVLRNELVDIIGFYSERHAGVFVSKYAPAVTPESGRTNAIHIHFISRGSEATGHIDDITMSGGMVLRLPADA
jgi:acetolactate decarboxylase